MQYEKAWLTLGFSAVIAFLIFTGVLVYINPPYKVYRDEGAGRTLYSRVSIWSGNVVTTFYTDEPGGWD